MYVHLEKFWVDSLQHTRLPAGIFLLFLTLKTTKKFQWANGTATRVCYVANESTLCLFWLL